MNNFALNIVIGVIVASVTGALLIVGKPFLIEWGKTWHAWEKQTRANITHLRRAPMAFVMVAQALYFGWLWIATGPITRVELAAGIWIAFASSLVIAMTFVWSFMRLLAPGLAYERPRTRG